MCAGIEFAERRVLWASDDPQLPILNKDGSVSWATWGRSYTLPDSALSPAGGWARLESLKEGRWKRWRPRPVKIPATSFMERAKDGSAVWFPIDPALVIQGCALLIPNRTQIAELGDTLVRVYVVTIPAAGEPARVHDRMPRLVPRQAPHQP